MKPSLTHLVLSLIIACGLACPAPAQSPTPVASPQRAATQTPAEQLAASIIAARTEERAALLAGHKELVGIELVRALNKQNRRLVDRGEYARALEVADVTRSLAGELKDQSGVAQALHLSGVALTYQGEYRKALELYRESLALRRTLGDKADIAASLNALGFVSDALGNYTLALEYNQQSLALREGLGDKSLIASSLNNLGIVYDSLGEYDQALDHYRRSAALRADSGSDRTALAQTLTNIGVTFASRGDYAQAAISYRKALELLDSLDAKRVRAQTLYDLGVLLKLQGDDEQALLYYRRNLALKEELGDKAGIARTLTAIGAIYDNQGDYQRALENYRQALKINEEVGDRLALATTLSNIGMVESEQGHIEQALEFYRRSLAVSDELKEKFHLTFTLNQLAGLMLRRGQSAQALEYAERSVAVSQETGNRESLWQALDVMGKAHRALNQPARAKQSFTDAIAAVEDLRSHVAGGELERQRFFESKLAPYQSLVEMLADEGATGEALAFAERAKARTLLDVLETGRVQITKAMTTAEQEQERKLNAQLVSLNEQLEKEQARSQPDAASLADLQGQQGAARLAYESFQTSLYAAHPDLRAQRGQAQPFTLTDARSLLDEQTALLEFVLTEEKAYLFVLTLAGGAEERERRGDAATRRRGEKEDLASRRGAPAQPLLAVYPLDVKGADLIEQARSFRRLLAERNLDFQTPARKLYDALIRPAEKQLRGKTALCIVPDGALWELPFQALQPPDGAYLIEHYAVFYAPSLSVLRRMREQHSEAAPKLLAFGNPALNDETLERVRAAERDSALGSLPEAEKEVETLAELYGRARSQVFTGASAREAAFKREAEHFNILHFATHATLDDRAPMYSRIVLARDGGDKDEDGLLEAREVLRMNLRADLVTLSACQTARGRVGAGEGMIGMSWAFFVAGSPNLVVSQWRVNSASTTDLMIAFHRRLTAPGAQNVALAKASALREAAQALLKDKRYRHPFYWAGFVLIGDGS